MNKAHSYSKSLHTLFIEHVRPRLSQNRIFILDIGAGNYSMFEDVIDQNAEITAIDFSKNAINDAPKSHIKYLEGNVTDPAFFPTSTYDLIFDSHTLNCITNELERDLAFNNIYSALKPGGLFASEMMIQPFAATVSMPFKMIKSALELEQEITSWGFRILYFMVSRDSGFTNMTDGIETKCDLVKIVAQK